MAVNPVAAATYFVQQLGCTAFPVWGSKDGRCNCGDPHDGKTGKHGPDNVGKHPATPHGFKEGTTDPEAIKKFLSNPGTPNYGLTAPPGVLVIDVDGADGLAKWDDLQHRYGPLPVTLTTTTANGRHYFYRWPESAGPMPGGKLFGFVVRRSDDGYVIGPGSVHPKGTTYDTLRRDDGHPYAIADLPPRWAEAALKPEATTIRVGGGVDPSTVGVGGRHDTLRDHARFLAGSIRDADELFAAVWTFNQKFPVPKSEADVRRAIGEALTRFPADPVSVNPETGEVERQPGGGGVILDLEDEARFPDPPHEDAFGGLVGEVVDELARGTDAPRIGLLSCLLAFLGALVPAAGHFGRPQASSLFVGLVGPSGEGRKGTAMARVHDLLSATLGYDVVARSLLDGVNSGEGLVTGLEFRQRAWKREPASVILYEEEFATLLAAQNRDGSSLDSRLRTMWDIGVLSNRRREGSQSVVPPYWASALVAITPDELRHKSPEKATTTGSYNRWLWVPVVRRDEDVEDSPPDLPGRLVDVLVESHRKAFEEPPYLPLERDAGKVLTAYSRHLTAHAVGLESALSTRMVPLAYRIGMIHAAVERAPKVTAEQLRRGIAVTEYARSGVGWVFGYTVGDRYAGLLLRHLREQGSMTMHEITQSVVRDSLKRQAAIDELREMGFAERVRVGTSGRPRYELRFVPSRGLFTPFVQSVHPTPLPERG